MFLALGSFNKVRAIDITNEKRPEGVERVAEQFALELSNPTSPTAIRQKKCRDILNSSPTKSFSFGAIRNWQEDFPSPRLVESFDENIEDMMITLRRRSEYSPVRRNPLSHTTDGIPKFGATAAERMDTEDETYDDFEGYGLRRRPKKEDTNSTSDILLQTTTTPTKTTTTTTAKMSALMKASGCLEEMDTEDELETVKEGDYQSVCRLNTVRAVGSDKLLEETIIEEVKQDFTETETMDVTPEEKRESHLIF